MTAGGLIAVLAFAVDSCINGNYYYAWKMALTAVKMAKLIDQNICTDVLLGSLLQDTGANIGWKHILEFGDIKNRIADPNIAGHSSLGASILRNILEMEQAGIYVANHHIWFRGSRYNDRSEDSNLPGSQILALVDIASRSGCFSNPNMLEQSIGQIFPYTNKAWNTTIWDAFINVVRDPDFINSMEDPMALRNMMQNALKEIHLPEELKGDGGFQRAIHIFPLVLDMKNPPAVGHSLRVARYAGSLASQLKLSESQITLAYNAGLLHDIGILGIPTDILMNRGKLNSEEQRIMQKHAAMTTVSLLSIEDPRLAELARVAGYDHECYDGSGYPCGLSGSDIPIISRILAVVDSFDMIKSKTNGKLPAREIVRRVKQFSGTHFDPDITEAFDALLGTVASSQDHSECSLELWKKAS